LKINAIFSEKECNLQNIGIEYRGNESMCEPVKIEILNFIEINEHLGTGGMPSCEQIEMIHKAGYEVVINLALKNSPTALPDEAERVAENGMIYIHIPVVWEAPKLVDLQKFFETMRTYANNKIFVHCVLNMRVSVFVFLYRTICLNTPVETAFEVVHQIWEPDDVWEEFILTAFDYYHVNTA
jgi:protein tyrosine phosphatase (PTP) superfamily phosphohydrolase (DUF442 family)